METPNFGARANIIFWLAGLPLLALANWMLCLIPLVPDVLFEGYVICAAVINWLQWTNSVPTEEPFPTREKIITASFTYPAFALGWPRSASNVWARLRNKSLRFW